MLLVTAACRCHAAADQFILWCGPQPRHCLISKPAKNNISVYILLYSSEQSACIRHYMKIITTDSMLFHRQRVEEYLTIWFTHRQTCRCPRRTAQVRTNVSFSLLCDLFTCTSSVRSRCEIVNDTDCSLSPAESCTVFEVLLITVPVHTWRSVTQYRLLQEASGKRPALTDQEPKSFAGGS